jgi:hypothetical protein
VAIEKRRRRESEHLAKIYCKTKQSIHQTIRDANPGSNVSAYSFDLMDLDPYSEYICNSESEVLITLQFWKKTLN